MENVIYHLTLNQNQKGLNNVVVIEIEEETGLRREEVELVRKGGPVVAENGGVRWVVHPYLFRTREGDKIRIDWEHSSKRWIKPEEIDSYLTVPGLKEALSRVYQP